MSGHVVFEDLPLCGCRVFLLWLILGMRHHQKKAGVLVCWCRRQPWPYFKGEEVIFYILWALGISSIEGGGDKKSRIGFMSIEIFCNREMTSIEEGLIRRRNLLIGISWETKYFFDFWENVTWKLCWHKGHLWKKKGKWLASYEFFWLKLQWRQNQTY